MRRPLAVGAWFVCIASLFSAAAAARDLVIVNGRLVDGTGAPPREGVAIRIHDDRIVEIAATVEAPAGATTLDASGLTVLPGFIDAHVHFVAAPGSQARGDDDAAIDALNHRHLAAYVAAGVTTVLDAGAFPEVARAIQQKVAAGHPAPRYLTLGPYVRPVGGYGSDRFGAEATPAEVERKLDAIRSLGGVGVKIGIEPGAAPFPPEIRAALVDGARRRGLPLYIHAMSEGAQREALGFGAYALMHAAMQIRILWSEPDLSDAFLAELLDSGAYQLSTLSVFETFPEAFPRALLDEPRARLLVPAVELHTARAPDAVERFGAELIGFGLPWTFAFTRGWIAREFLTPARVLEAVRQGQRNLLRAARAGVPIVAATDAPSPWPMAITNFHGYQFARELALLREAGLSGEEVIAAATRTPARMLGLDGQIGTVEVGKLADLVLVRGDPLADPRAFEAVAWSVRDGLARTPAEWMSAP
jgi:imidazolonepropionase-like amidohydrolase